MKKRVLLFLFCLDYLYNVCVNYIIGFNCKCGS
jgi:hypothetical protein